MKRKLGSVTVVAIAIIAIMVIIGGGIFLYSYSSGEPPIGDDIGEASISPSKAYLICNGESCTSEEVVIEGEMKYGFTISDGENTVFTSFEEGVTFLDEIGAIENNHLLGDGIVRVKVTGRISHDTGMCDNSGCEDMVIMTINPEDIEFIEEVGCKTSGGRWQLGMENCFDYSSFDLLATDAYNNLMNSEIGQEEDWEFASYWDYSFEGNFWRFQIVKDDRPGGCSDYFNVYKNKVVYKRSCANNALEEVREEIIN